MTAKLPDIEIDRGVGYTDRRGFLMRLSLAAVADGAGR
jgi:hypothetical protein